MRLARRTLGTAVWLSGAGKAAAVAAAGGCVALGAALAIAGPGMAADSPKEVTGAAAYGDWSKDVPGLRRRITADDMPKPYATKPTAHSPRVVAQPAGFLPKVPPGFAVEKLADGLSGPRTMAVAPNGDIFVAETLGGRVSVLRPKKGGGIESRSVFAAKLGEPYGLAFYPSGNDPQWLYVSNSTSVLRFPYRVGDVEARGTAEKIVKDLPGGGHSTRGIAFTNDGKRLLVAVGSASNVAEGLKPQSSAAARDHDSKLGVLGAGWNEEERRAVVLSFNPAGGEERHFATGLRNCVTVAVHPSGDAWCTVNERDGLGDDLVPDYVTRIAEGNFFGWPWFYIGHHEDPRLAGQRAELKDKVRVPDVLIQPHSAALGLAFYHGTQFPPVYVGTGFVALHGSWNRSKPTGYKVVRLVMDRGVPNGEYEDFMTGFVASDDKVMGRPVGVAVAADGSLLVSEDGNGTIWRVSYRGP